MRLWEEFNTLDIHHYRNQHPELFDYVRERMASPDKKYFLIGDTSHYDENFQDFISGLPLAALLKHAGISDICIENPRESISPDELAAYKAAVDDAPEQTTKDFWLNYHHERWRWSNDYAIHSHSENFEALSREHTDFDRLISQAKELPPIDRERLHEIFKDDHGHQFLESYVARPLLGFSRAGLTVYPADSWQWHLVSTDAERIFLGDREVADYILSRTAQAEKVAVLYGATHFQYDRTLGDHLGRENALYIDFYQNRETYRESLKYHNTHADVMPERVYLIEERTLEAPHPALYHIAADKMNDDVQKWKQALTDTFGPCANPAFRMEAMKRIVKLPATDPKYFNFEP